jgi:hypothetical protein
VRTVGEFAGAANLGDTFGFGEVSMRLTYALFALGLAAACGGDDYPTPAGGLDAGPADGPVADADPNAPDADPTAPDADPNAPDADPNAPGTDDGRGPTIIVTNEPPLSGRLVAGVLELEFTVEDPDGVNLNSVGATIRGAGGDPISFANVRAVSANTWAGTFDTRLLSRIVFPVIEIVAEDVPGNKGELGVHIAIDNVPPVADLDPPRVREIRITPTDRMCSLSFDPVGSDAPSDGELVRQFIELRARVVDRPNDGTFTSNVVVPMAGVAPAGVELLILDNTDIPLIVDTDNDTICDAVSPNVVPMRVPRASNHAVLITLEGLEADGASVFPTSNPDGDPFIGSSAGCFIDQAVAPPARLCFGADDATRIPGTSGGEDPMIFAPPTPRDEDACMGDFVDSRGANLVDGWACAAIRATDGLGNTSVSPVLRICIDANRDGQDGCPALGVPAPIGSRPDCTGTLVGTTVTDTPCTAVEFDEPEIVGDHELLLID